MDTPTLVAFPTSTPFGGLPVPRATVGALPDARASASLPIVQLVSPSANMQISVNQTFYVVVYAADDNGIARIELTDDHVLVRAETAPAPAPMVYSTIIPWTPAQIGPHVLRVVAFDADNRASAADDATVNVVQDARRPTSIIVYPIGTPQVELGSLLQVYGVATDEVAVTQVDLWVDNQLYTYLTSQNPNGQATFPFTFTWHALTPGNHTLFARAHDNQDQTTDSGSLRLFVLDNNAPALDVGFDRTNVLVNEPITVTISALDVSGIQRVELWTGREISGTVSSASPARQTSLTAQIIWQNGAPGDYQLTARAYSANGNVKESAAQTISVLRPGQATPTPAPTTTPTRTRAPRATATPRLRPAQPPSAELVYPTDNFSNTSPLRATLNGQGNAELDHLELWAFYPGQSQPQIACVIDARATTQKAGQCDWSPPTSGAVSLFAQAVDVYHQSGRSPTISGTISLPALPTPTPTPLSFAGRWNASVGGGQYVVTLRQVGATLRGDFKIAAAPTDADGRVTSGTIKGDRITFRVDFPSPVLPTVTPGSGTETSTPVATPSAVPAPPPAMDFDCAADASLAVLTCTFKDARGRSGIAVFRRETTP